MLLFPRDNVPDSPDIVESGAIAERYVKGRCNSNVAVRDESSARVKRLYGGGIGNGAVARDL